MSNYTENPAMCRIDIFKENMKWYTTISVEIDYEEPLIHDALRKGLSKYFSEWDGKEHYVGMWAICLEPYHKHSHPVALRIDRALAPAPREEE